MMARSEASFFTSGCSAIMARMAPGSDVIVTFSAAMLSIARCGSKCTLTCAPPTSGIVQTAKDVARWNSGPECCQLSSRVAASATTPSSPPAYMLRFVRHTPFGSPVVPLV
jgi:hypothetical protein